MPKHNTGQKSAVLLIISVAILIVIGLLILQYVLFEATSVLVIVLGVVAAAALFSIAALIIYILAYAIRKAKINFFLYNRKSKSSVTVDELAFDVINEKLTLYFGLFLANSDSSIRSWASKKVGLEMEPEYRVLYYPWLIHTFIENDQIELWQALTSAPKEMIDAFENSLFACGAVELSQRLQFLRATFAGDISPMRDYLLAKKNDLQNAMTNYVKTNIHQYE